MSSSAKQFFLASESPRRRKILHDGGYQFVLLPIKVSERIDKNLNSEGQIKAIAEEKMAEAREQAKLLKYNDYLILTADTMVYHQGEPLGKPTSQQDAVSTLTRLSASTHVVHTAVCIFDEVSCQQICEVASTQVRFRALSQDEIWQYVKSGAPMDKAGSYGAQDEGKNFIEKIDGDFDTVVGLPMKLTSELLKRFGVLPCR